MYAVYHSYFVIFIAAFSDRFSIQINMILPNAQDRELLICQSVFPNYVQLLVIASVPQGVDCVECYGDRALC